MALQKQIIQPSAVETTYHRIEAIHGIQRNGSCELYMGEYISAEARFNSEAQPVNHHRHNVQLSPQTVDQIMSLIYADPEFLSGRYEGAEVRDPDPEKTATQEVEV